MDFSIELAKTLLDSNDEFPVDLEQAWQWLGYSTKQKALKTLEFYFEEKVDYIFKIDELNSQDENNQMVKKPRAGRSSHLYFLTTNCLKEFGMIARTAKGKEIRKYFLECEKIAKQAIEQQQSQLIQESTELPLILPTEKELDYMRSRAWEKSEMMGLPVSLEKIKQRTGYRRAIDVMRNLQVQAEQKSIAGSEEGGN